MRKVLLSLSIPFLASLGLFAQTAPPADLSGESLRIWLQDNWYEGKHTELGYSAAREYMYSYIDKKEDGRVYGVYTGYSQPAATTTFLDPVNAEHTIPQSFFSKAEPMRSDIHHLYPTHKDVNAERGNYPFNEIPDAETDMWYTVGADNSYFTTITIPSPEVISSYSEKDGEVFEPREDHKGDLARSIFYFFTMYPEAAGEISRLVVDGNVQLLYEWHIQDPVSEWERQRNQRIAEKQGNLNPYVSYPAIACRAWNLSCTSQNIHITSAMETFGKTLFGFASTPQSYTVEAENLSENLIIQSSPDFQLALINDPSEFTDSLNLTVTDGNLAATTIYVRFTPSYAAERLISGSLLHYSGSEQANFTVQGLEGDSNIQEEVLLTEDFNECSYLANGWAAVSLSSNKNWECLSFGRDNSNAAEMNGYEGDEGSDDWLISPPVNLSGANGATLNFWTRSHYAGDEQSLKVYVSTAYTGDVSTTDWEALDVDLPQSGSKQWVQSEVDLSGYEGEEVHIAFQYEASSTFPSWTIDDFKVVNKVAPDYYVASFIAADTILMEESAEITAKVFLDHKATMPFNLNLQLETINSKNIELAISPETNNEQLITLHFAPGDSVKTIHIAVSKNADLADTAAINLLLEPSFYVSAGENSSYSITVPADEQEEAPEPKPTGINDEFSSRLKVYPNPASSVIEVDGVERGFRYIVRSMSGKLLLKGTYDFSQGIAVNDLGSGIYFLQLEMDDLVVTKLIMINR